MNSDDTKRDVASKRHIRLVAVGAGVVAVSAIAMGTSSILETLYPSNSTVTFSVELRSADDSPDQKLTVTRGPIDFDTHTCTVSATLEVHRPGVTLSSFSIKAGNDDNEDAAIQPSELTTIATGTITTVNGVVTGQIVNAVVPTNKHCVRIVYERSDSGVGYDEFFTDNIDPYSYD
jgi:hypothetical protein